jgi:DNA-binding response OmpR family regulator
MEDDQLVQAMVQDVLSEAGFEAAIIASGEEAVALLQANISPYRAVVTDINLLGRLDSWEAAWVARETAQTMPIIYMTGTHGEEWASKGVPNSIILTKPLPLRS